MRDVVVVGGGLFGSIVYDHLEKMGLYVLMVDDKRKNRGSDPAGCLIKPSWLSSMNKRQIEDSLTILDALYGVEQVPFTYHPLRSILMDIQRVKPSKVLTRKMHQIDGTVVRLIRNKSSVGVELNNQQFIEAKNVVLACGAWGAELAPHLKVKAQMGWSFLWNVKRPGPGFMKLWAPYRQLIGFQIEEATYWAGDGSALKPETATAERMLESLRRCSSALELPESEVNVLLGGRPYAEKTPGMPCVFENENGVTLINGGAKNGTIAAGWCASEIMRVLR